MSSEESGSLRTDMFFLWLQSNWKRLVTVVGVAAVAVILLNEQNRTARALEREAAAALIDLQVDFKSPGGQAGKPKAEAFFAVMDKYAGTPAAEHALMMGAGALFREGSYKDADTRFSTYLEQYPQGELRSIAMLGKASCLDAQNEVDKAIGAYEQLVAAYPNDTVTDQARMSLALLLETKDPAKAMKMYEALAKPSDPAAMMGNGVAREATERMRVLARNHPELKPALAVPSPISPMMLPEGLNLQ